MELFSPCILGFGSTLDDPSNFKVAIEKENIIDMPNLLMAMKYCFSCYYVMNIQYPKLLVHSCYF